MSTDFNWFDFIAMYSFFVLLIHEEPTYAFCSLVAFLALSSVTNVGLRSVK